MPSVPGKKATLGEAAVFRPGQIPEKHSPENCGPPTIPGAGGRKRNISASVPKVVWGTANLGGIQSRYCLFYKI